MSETKAFQTEVQQLLDLVIHSLYSNPEIFLRELISNASDAIDRARFLSLTDKTIAEPLGGYKIKLEVDAENKRLYIRDNGVGMTAEEVEANIGTIARSGTKAFLKGLSETEAQERPELIGQFGVGFYSAFMVADKVELITLRAGDGNTPVHWASAGDGSYEIGEAERDFYGTEIILHMKDDAAEYLDRYKLTSIVKKYSDYISIPVVMDKEPEPPAEDDASDESTDENAAEDKAEEAKDEGKVDETPATPEEETLNAMKALWALPKSEVTDEEYKEFYKARFYDWVDPVRTVHFAAEGTLEYKALVFVPAKRPPDFMREQVGKGIQLYVKRVQIMSDCEALLPDYLGFVRGVVDSSDLSLNVSREILQEDRTLAKIRKSLVGRVLKSLKELKTKDSETYNAFFKEFGANLKDGVCRSDDHKDALLEIIHFESSKTEEGSPITLKDYVDRMQPDQKAIYFLAGSNKEQAESSPYLEAFKKKDLEVLYFSEPIDEWFSDSAGPFNDKPLQAIDKGDVDIHTEDEKTAAETQKKDAEKKFKPVLECLNEQLKEDVKEVRFTGRLTDSVAVLVAESYGMSANQERLMKAFGQDVAPSKRILEVNPDHPLMEKLLTMVEDDKANPLVNDYVELIHAQALIHEGSPVKDPSRFTKLVTQLMVK